MQPPTSSPTSAHGVPVLVKLRLAMLGDSIACGDGVSRATDRLAPRLTAGLAAVGVEVLTEVVALGGARSADLERQVGLALAWRPDTALVIIGANDVTHLVSTSDAVRALTDCVRRLRDAGAEVVVAPAPDLSNVPRVPTSLRRLVRRASLEMRRRQIEAVLPLGARIADPDQATARAFAADPRLFSPDGLHPSSAGYAVIADALLLVLLAAVSPERLAP